MPKTKDEIIEFRFTGFSGPNSTQVPDAFFDVVVPHLGESELKVSLYIIRRTFGFKKETDNISLSQLVNGITTRDGRVLDRGTGLAKSGVTKALKSLVAKGIIVKQTNRSLERGNEPTTYALNFIDGPLSTPVDKGVSTSVDKGLSTPVDTQETVEQETVRQKTESSNSFEYDANLQQNGTTSKFSKKRDNFDKNSTLEQLPPEPQRTTQSKGFTPVAELLATRVQKPAPRSSREASELPQAPMSGSSHQEISRPRQKGRGRPPKAPEQVEWLITNISGEFHDEEHTRQNIGQAARLWKSSGLSEAAFCQLVGEARAETKQRVIEKPASGEAGEWGARNKMPYFYKVLRDYLGMKDEKTSSRKSKGDFSSTQFT